MTNPYARPEEPQDQAWPSSQDETIPLVPESGYATRPSPWSEGYEHTAVDPVGEQWSPGGYANPSFGAPGPTAQPQPQPRPQPSYPTTPSYPPPQSYPSAGPQLPPQAYEQPPSSGYTPYEPAREAARGPLLPAYPASYPLPSQLPEHPNAVPTLVLAIVGFFVWVTLPIAWFLGARGSAATKRNPGRWRQSSMMTVGMVIGIIGTVLMLLGFGFFAMIMAAVIFSAG